MLGGTSKPSSEDSHTVLQDTNVKQCMHACRCISIDRSSGGNQVTFIEVVAIALRHKGIVNLTFQN
jgi:hypothetical protein